MNEVNDEQEGGIGRDWDRGLFGVGCRRISSFMVPWVVG